MYTKTASPFDGFPTTYEKHDGEGQFVSATVVVSAIGPSGKFSANKLRWIVGAAFASGSAVALFNAPEFDPAELLLPPLYFLSGTVAGHFGLAQLLKSRKRFRFTRDTFAARGVGGRWTVYDRHQPHRFVLREHSWAKYEERWIEFFRARASAKGRGTLMRPYFGESYHLCIEFGRQPIKLATIYGKTKADRALGRFVALDEAFDATVIGRSGIASKPEDQWSRNENGLAEEF